MSTIVKTVGMSTGLNTADIIEKILTVDGLTIKTLESKQQLAKEKKEFWEAIETSLYELNDALNALSKMSGGDNYYEIGTVDANGNIVFSTEMAKKLARAVIQNITMSEEGYLDYVQTGFPNDGLYEIHVEQMWRHATAQSNKQYLNGRTIGVSGEIFLGDSEEIYINRRDTIEDVANKINNAKKKDGTALGIRATVENGYLKLEEDIGNNQLIAANGEDTYMLYMLGLMDVHEWNSGGYQLANKLEALQTIINVNGQTFTSNNEVFTDAIEGLELTIEKLTNPDNPVYIHIESHDDETLKDDDVTERGDAIIDIFHKINAMLTMISDNSKYNKDTNKAGNLLPDYMSRALKNKTMDSLSTRYNAGDLNYIYNLGVQRNEDGLYDIDENVLSHRIKNRWDDVYSMLMEKENGIFVKFNNVINHYIIGRDSLIELKIGDYTKEISKYDDMIEDKTERIEKKRKILEAQFTALEQTFNSNNIVQSYLSNVEDYMVGFTSKRKSSK